MTDEVALTKAMGDAAHAQTLIEDEMLQNALSAMETSYINAWRSTGPRDTDSRERLWQAVQIVGKVRDHLAHVVSGGKIAKSEIDDIAGKQRLFGIL